MQLAKHVLQSHPTMTMQDAPVASERCLGLKTCNYHGWQMMQQCAQHCMEDVKW